MLSVQQKHKQKPPERGADPATTQGSAATDAWTDSDGALLAREEAVARSEAALSALKAAHADSVAVREAQLAHREAAVQQAEERIAAKEVLAAQRLADVAHAEAEVQAAKLALSEREAGVAAREATLAEAEAALHEVRCHRLTRAWLAQLSDAQTKTGHCPQANSNLKDHQVHLSATESSIADHQQQPTAACASTLPKDNAPVDVDLVSAVRAAMHAAPGTARPGQARPLGTRTLSSPPRARLMGVTPLVSRRRLRLQ